MSGLSTERRQVRRYPTRGFQRNIFHFIVLGWYEVLMEVPAVAARFHIYSSPEGRKEMYEYNRLTSRRLNILKGGQFPSVDYRTDGEQPVAAAKVLVSLVKDALYISHTGSFPGTDRKRRDSRLRKWGYFA